MANSSKADERSAPTLSRQEAAAYLTAKGLRTTKRALEIRAANNNAGNGPAYTRIGWNCVRYALADLDAWYGSQVRKVA